MRGLQVLELAKEILKTRADLEAVVFYDKNGKLVVLEKDAIEAKPFSPESEAEQARKGKRFTIYSEEYATGADIPQHEQARALLTLDKKMTLRDFRQAIFRMRKIQENQACTILIDRDIQSYMEQALAPEKDMSHLSAVVRFLIKNEVTKRLDENYQSAEQRAKNSIQASLRRAMFDLLLRNPPDFDKALSILKEGEIFFIQKDAISPFERYGKIPKPIARREWIDKKQEQYAESFKKLAQIEEVQQALGKRGETEEAIAEFLQQEISKLYVESQFEETLLESDPQLEMGRLVHVQAIISQESIQKSLLQVGEILADCDRVLNTPIVHASALAVQKSLKNAIEEAKASWQLQTSTFRVKNQEVAYQETDQLLSHVHRLRFHLDACHTLDRYEAQAEAVLRRRSEPITKVCDEIERLLAQLAACNVTKPIGAGVDRLNELVQEGEQLLLAAGVIRQEKEKEEERKQALQKRLEIGLQTFQGKELSVSHQAALKSHIGTVLTEESVRAAEMSLRQILALHEASMELKKVLILVPEGSLHEAFLQWEEALSSSLSIDQERKNELEAAAISAILMSDNKEALLQLVQGAVLSRSEFQEINKTCIQRLYFIEKRERSIFAVQELKRLFPANKEIEAAVQKITVEKPSLEELDALLQRMAFLKKNADLLLGSKGVVDGLLAAVSPAIGTIGKRAGVLWQEVYDKASLTLSSQAVEEVRLAAGEVERVLSQAASFSASKTKGLELVEASLFRFNLPPFGRLKESMQKGHRLQLRLQNLLKEKDRSIQTSSLAEIASHFQVKREALDQAIQGLQTETETFTQEQASLLHKDQEELRSLVESLRHDLAEVHVSEEKKEEIESLLHILEEALLEEVPLGKYSDLLNKKGTYAQAKAALQELVETRQRELEDRPRLAYLKKELGLKKSAFELQGSRSEYAKRLLAIPTMIEMGKKMAAVASTKEKITELEQELEVADFSFQKLKQKMEAHSSKLTLLPQLKLFAAGRLQILSEKTAKLERDFRQCQATKKDGEPRKIALEIQAELIEYEKEVLALALLSSKGEQVYALLDKTSPLSEKDQKKVLEILRELFLDNRVMNIGEMMDPAHIAAEKNVEKRQIKEGWNRRLVTFFQGLAVNEELFAEAVSFLMAFLPDPSRRAEVLSLLTEKRQTIEIAEMKDRCESALRDLQLGEDVSFSEVQDQFKIFMTALQSEISGVATRHRALFSKSGISLQDPVEQACRDAMGAYQLQAVGVIAGYFESHLDGVSLSELEARCDFVRFYSRVAAAIQLRGEELSQTKASAGRSVAILQRSERTLQEKIHEEESLIWRQEVVLKVARVGKNVLRNTAIMGLGAFIAQIPGFSEVGREIIGHGYQGAIMSVAQPIVQGLASGLPPSLQMVSETLLLEGVALLAAQGQEFVAKGAEKLAGRVINPITRYVGESRLQTQLEAQFKQEQSQEPERRAQLRADAHKKIETERAAKEARQLQESAQEHEAHEASVKRHIDRASKRHGISEGRTQEDLLQTVKQMTLSERAEYGRTHALTTEETTAFHAVEHAEALEVQAAMEIHQKGTPGPSGGVQEEPQAAKDGVHMKMASVAEASTAQPSILDPMGAESSTFAYSSGTVVPNRFEIPSKITSTAVPSLAPPLPGNSLLRTAGKTVLAFFIGPPKG